MGSHPISYNAGTVNDKLNIDGRLDSCMCRQYLGEKLPSALACRRGRLHS